MYTRDIQIKGGGVLIAVKNQFSSCRLSLQNNSIEQLFIKITFKSCSLIIGSVYIPPRSDIEYYVIHNNEIDNIMCNNSNSKFLIIGDYNLPNIKWVSTYNYATPNLLNLSNVDSNILAGFSYLNLLQYNLVYNRSGSLLDLVFSNADNVNVSSVIYPLIPLDQMYHPALLIKLSVMFIESLDYKEKIYDFINCDYYNIISDIASLDWNGILDCSDVNVAVEIFYKNILKIINLRCPIKYLYLPKYSLWFSTRLKQLIFKKKIAHLIYKRSPTQINYNSYSNIRALCKKQNKYDYNTFILNTQNSIITNPKLFWKYIKSKRSNSTLPASMTLNNLCYSGGDAISNAFAQYFSSIYSQQSTKVNMPNNCNLHSIDLNSCILNLSDVYEELNNLNNKTCAGPDNISNIFFVKCKFVLSVPLLKLFNLSLSSGIFPDNWKVSYISPIFKGGDVNQVTNYRPISIISIIPKIFESIVYKKINPLFKNIIIDDQHGFVSNKSTATNLLVFQHYVLDAFKLGHQVDVIYTDFSKAFDKINHKILSIKLYHLGLRNPFLSWVVSFISNRKQYIKYKHFCSSYFTVTSGVPQGSHLAPLLFNLFINDIKFSESRMLLYANDLKLFRIIKNSNDSELLQNDLNYLYNWCDFNNLYLNVSKCKVMTFTKKRTPYLHNYHFNNSKFIRVYQNKDLGVLFDTSLTFNSHYISIQNKASSFLGFIKRSCQDFKNPTALKALYCSHVRSVLDYNSIIWSPSTLGPKQILESIQNRFLRIISFRCEIFRQPHSSYQPLLTFLNLEPLEIRRKKFDLSFIFKLLNGQINCPILLSKLDFSVPSRNTRQSSTFYVPFQSTNYGLNTPIIRCMQLVNKYNVDIFSYVTVNTFNLYLNSIIF